MCPSKQIRSLIPLRAAVNQQESSEIVPTQSHEKQGGNVQGHTLQDRSCSVSFQDLPVAREQRDGTFTRSVFN